MQTTRECKKEHLIPKSDSDSCSFSAINNHWSRWINFIHFSNPSIYIIFNFNDQSQYKSLLQTLPCMTTLEYFFCKRKLVSLKRAFFCVSCLTIREGMNVRELQVDNFLLVSPETNHYRKQIPIEFQYAFSLQEQEAVNWTNATCTSTCTFQYHWTQSVEYESVINRTKERKKERKRAKLPNQLFVVLS